MTTRPRNHELVLAELRAADRALTAYELLDRLRDQGINAPPSVYRALARLVEDGSVHRIESLNAYTACCESHRSTPLLAICSDCGRVTEVAAAALDRTCRSAARAMDFEVDQAVFEIRGRCRACHETETRAPTP